MKEFWNGKRVLITGHTGFKGSWLAFWLKMLGADVCGYALAPETQPNLFENLQLESKIESVAGDVRDSEKFEKKLADFQPQIIFHLAAQSLVRRSYHQPVETYTTNVIGTINVLEAVRQTSFVKSVVVITTDKVYENKEWHWAYRENERLGGFDPYSNSKACAELAVSTYRNSFFGESETLIATARAGNVIGGGDWSEDRLLPDVFRSLVFGAKLEIRNPHSIRPWQHTLEPLAGYMKLAEKLYEGEKKFAEAWNFGPSDEDSKPVGWVLEEIRQNWNEPVNWEIAEGIQPHEARLLKLDSAKAKSELNWLPKLSLPEALTLTTEWYRGFKDKKDLTELTKNQINYYQGKNADKTA
ncbi:MAG TPA: CDP-glucose 4,6-dehydratase [Pyrinomonadaceae bacterium]|nr:CDP-glucose 4,6-dehydratase [Pyrinomonadaceae bacterium]